MKKYFIQIVKHPLISGSVIIFGGTLFANFLSFIFNWYMRRVLTNGDYGIFASLISLITLPGLATGALIPLVVNYAGEYFSSGKTDLARGFYQRIFKLFAIICFIIFTVFLFSIPQISVFFHINDLYLLVLTDVIIVLSVLTIINQSFLQAKLEFSYISLVTIFSSVLKLSLGVLFVMAGWKITGAIGGVFIAFLLPYLLTFLPLRTLLRHTEIKKPELNYPEMLKYAVPSALAILGTASFITTDLLLVKHFFSADEAGIYAGLSLAARIIYFFSAPIGTVMFPLIVNKQHKQENYRNTFFLSIFLVFGASLSLTVFYYLFPAYILNMFNIHSASGDNKLILVLFALVISIYALISILVNLYLSIKKTAIYLIVLAAAIAQGVGIWFFHDSFYTVLTVSLLSLFVLLLALLIYYPYATRKK